jgi:hypothetical protein
VLIVFIVEADMFKSVVYTRKKKKKKRRGKKIKEG